MLPGPHLVCAGSCPHHAPACVSIPTHHCLTVPHRPRAAGRAGNSMGNHIPSHPIPSPTLEPAEPRGAQRQGVFPAVTRRRCRSIPGGCCGCSPFPASWVPTVGFPSWQCRWIWCPRVQEQPGASEAAGEAGIQGILEEAGPGRLLCCQNAWLISSAPRSFSQDGSGERVFA